MKNIKNTTSFALTVVCCAVLFFTDKVSAQILQVTDVTVDSCWNSDSSWQNSKGIMQQRTSRDCKISFTPQGEGMARMFIALSIDSGKTWTPSPNPLSVMNQALAATFITGKKATITVRVLGGDRPGTVFKMIARQAVPVIAGNPKDITVGPKEVFTPGQSVNIQMNLRFVNEVSTNGICTISKVYWDVLGDGTIDDSTAGANVLTWTWLTQVPVGTFGQKRGVIARAVDKNGLASAPETLSVQFATMSDSVTDIDGNYYLAVNIGNQVWTVENLRTTKYRDGTAIPHVIDSAAWIMLTTPAYCFYKNTVNADSIKKFGGLYNWYAVNTGKLAPVGWHVPTDAEWTVLGNYLIANGYNYDGTTTVDRTAKAMAAKTDWSTSTSTSTGTIGDDLTKNNRSGFSALPGGLRDINGAFNGIGYSGLWWNATEYDALLAWNCFLGFNDANLIRPCFYKYCGYSVRLVRD